MQFSEIITPLLCGVSPFALGWIALSLLIGIRTGWEASIRLILLGLGLLGAVLILLSIVFFFPDWVALIIIAFAATFWFPLLRFFVMQKFSGKLLMGVQENSEKRLYSILRGTFSVVLGSSLIFGYQHLLSPAKSFALGLFLISFGIYRVLNNLRFTQIREKGILYKSGVLYKWENIERYVWKFGEDKLTLKLRRAFLKKNIDLKIYSPFRKEVVAYLAENVDNPEINAPTRLQLTKAG